MLVEKSDRIVGLMHSWMTDQISTEGALELEKFSTQSEENTSVLKEATILPAKDYFVDLLAYDTAKGWNVLKKRVLPGIYGEAGEGRSLLKYYLVAASLVGVVVLGVIGYLSMLKMKNVATVDFHVVRPATNYPTLVLADGSLLNLDSLPINSVVYQHELSLAKKGNQELVYTRNTEMAKGGVNTLWVPNGSKYKVVLPDGSTVWVNSSSNIQYPIRFEDTNRVIQLDGEGFFDVAKTGGPFIVKTDGVEISVVGTRFNVNSYNNEPIIRTSLIEGKLVVSKNDAKAYLVAGKEARIGRMDGAIEMGTCSPDVIDWTEGITNYYGSVDGFLRIMERRFAMEVLYKNVPVKFQKVRISVELSTAYPLSMWVQILNVVLGQPKNGNLKIEVKDNKLIVSSIK